MVEVAALEVTLPWVLTEGHPLDAPQVVFPVNDQLSLVQGYRVDHLLEALDSVAGVWVSRKPLRELASARSLAETSKRREHIGYLAHIVVLTQCIAEARLVRLILGIATVLEEQKAESGACQLAKLGDVGRENASDAEAKLSQLGFTNLLD
jgi:hypothetical protein